MKIGITGAHGYVGSYLAKYLEQENFHVIPFVRSAKKAKERSYHLEKLSIDLSEVDCLIHCAYSFTCPDNLSQQMNVSSVAYLSQKCLEQNVRLILISSLSASPMTRSKYGQEKIAAEKIVMKSGKADVIRIGLFYSEKCKGMLGSIVSLIKYLPVVPIIASHSKQYTCYGDDLCQLLKKILASPPGKIWIASEREGIKFGQLIKQITKEKSYKRLLIPIPTQCVFWGLKFLQMIGYKGRIRADAIYGLIDPPDPKSLEEENYRKNFRSFKPHLLS